MTLKSTFIKKKKSFKSTFCIYKLRVGNGEIWLDSRDAQRAHLCSFSCCALLSMCFVSCHTFFFQAQPAIHILCCRPCHAVPKKKKHDKKIFFKEGMPSCYCSFFSNLCIFWGLLPLVKFNRINMSKKKSQQNQKFKN